MRPRAIVTAMVGVKKRRGRPKGSGGPPEGARRNRVTATFTDAELAQLERLAASKNIPLGTMLYLLTKISLGRRRLTTTARLLDAEIELVLAGDEPAGQGERGRRRGTQGRAEPAAPSGPPTSWTTQGPPRGFLENVRPRRVSCAGGQASVTDVTAGRAGAGAGDQRQTVSLVGARLASRRRRPPHANAHRAEQSAVCAART